jgi:hypothetical protein
MLRSMRSNKPDVEIGIRPDHVLDCSHLLACMGKFSTARVNTGCCMVPPRLGITLDAIGKSSVTWITGQSSSAMVTLLRYTSAQAWIKFWDAR